MWLENATDKMMTYVGVVLTLIAVIGSTGALILLLGLLAKFTLVLVAA